MRKFPIRAHNKSPLHFLFYSSRKNAVLNFKLVLHKIFPSFLHILKKSLAFMRIKNYNNCIKTIIQQCNNTGKDMGRG